MEKVLRVAITGHRPGRVANIEGAHAAVGAALNRMKAKRPELMLLVGGALGFDQWMAWGAVAAGGPDDVGGAVPTCRGGKSAATH